MWRKILQIVGVVVAMALIVAYICYASYLAREQRSTQRVNQLVITMEDANSERRLSSPDVIFEQLQNDGVKISEELMDSVNVARILKVVSANAYVKSADFYITYSGVAHLEVAQHTPVLRMLNSGFNSYVTADGTIFRAPDGAACHVSVVTGSYKPRFPSSYEGNVADYYASLQAKEDEKLAELKEEFTELDSERRGVINKKSELKDDLRRKLFESKESHQQRQVGIKAEIAKCNDELLELKGAEAKLCKREKVIEKRKKKLQKSYDDFMNLINFVSRVRNDRFWGAEVVQFIASTNHEGEISLRLIPRSGDFVIEFGTLADSEEKLAKLEQFYDKGLPRIGWGLYKTIDVRYDKQIICKK